MSNVYINAFEIVSPAGRNIEEVFENILDKRCFIVQKEELGVGDSMLASGKIDDMAQAVKFVTKECMSGFDTGSTALFISCENIKVNQGFKSVKLFNNSTVAVKEAFDAISKGIEENVLVLAIHTALKDDILALFADGIYSSAVSKPFDIDTDGLNTADVVVGILFGSKSSRFELKSASVEQDFKKAIENGLTSAGFAADNIDYIETAAYGVPQTDREEATILSEIFGQKPLVSSSKAMTGHTFEASALTSLVLALKAADEDIVPASGFLEHSFTNEITFAYANKPKKIKNFLVNSREENGVYGSFVLSKA